MACFDAVIHHGCNKNGSQPPFNRGTVSDVLTVIVTFNGDRTIKDTLARCHSAVRHRGPIVVFDNASIDTTANTIEEMGLSGVHLIPLPENIGVAAAYNLALAQARRVRARWLFILDQDSLCGNDCLDILLEAAEPNSSGIGALCPTVVNSRFPWMIHYPLRWDGKQYCPFAPDFTREYTAAFEVDSTVTSGTLYSVAALTAVNGFRENYFIDFVDHECHMRLRIKGFHILWIPMARIRHQLGIRQEMTSKGLWIEHPPYRYYYMVRNMFDGYRRLAGLRALGGFGAEILRHYLLICRQGRAPVITLGYILKGLYHAVRGKFGAIDGH